MEMEREADEADARALRREREVREAMVRVMKRSKDRWIERWHGMEIQTVWGAERGSRRKL